MAKESKQRKMVIQSAVILAFIFGLIVAFLAYATGNLLFGQIFMQTLMIVILLAMLFVLERIAELLEAR